MKVVEISSKAELEENLKKEKRSFLLLFKKGAEQSDCAYSNYASASDSIESIRLLSANVNEVRDIHPHYQITSVPTFIEFDGTEPKNVVKGCHESAYYRAVLEDAVYKTKSGGKTDTQKRVVVYSTPSCSWCNTLKSYLRQHNIKYTDINVASNESSAQEMVRRSGQQGVPQTDINGTIIVGFDKKRINDLLGING